MNNEIKQNLLKVAYNLLSDGNRECVIDAVQTMISAVVEMTDMEMPDKFNVDDDNEKPYYDEENNIMYHDGKDARITYLQSIIDGKNVKISSLEEIIKDKQKNIEYFNQLIQDKNSEISALEKHLNNNSQLKSVLENNKIRLIKAIRRALKDDKYNDADVRDDKYGSKYNHISNLKQSKDLFEEILRNVIE